MGFTGPPLICKPGSWSPPGPVCALPTCSGDLGILKAGTEQEALWLFGNCCCQVKALYLHGPCMARAGICLPKQELLHLPSPPAPPSWLQPGIEPIHTGINGHCPFEGQRAASAIPEEKIPGNDTEVPPPHARDEQREIKTLNSSRMDHQIPHFLGAAPPGWSMNLE